MAYVGQGGLPDLMADTPQPAVVQNTPTPIPLTSTPDVLYFTVQPSETENPPMLYYARAGDTIKAVAAHFGVEVADIQSPDPIPPDSLLEPNQLLVIPDILENTTPSDLLVPDSEIAFSPSTVNFDIQQFADDANGYLKDYIQWLPNENYNGAGVINLVAHENSVNPRILLALVEFEGHWVYGDPHNLSEQDYPIGIEDYSHLGLYRQLSWAVNKLSIGYYGWRAGTLTELTFPDGTTLRMAPDINAGTAAIQYLFSNLYNREEWYNVLYGNESFPLLFESMFGNPWLRALTVEPLYPPDLTQPEMLLPFEKGLTWSYTGGPHAAWGPDGVLAALDFAPPADEHGCAPSTEWVTAAAGGLVVRSRLGQVVIDLDGDGYEQTGWDLFYLHIANLDRIALNTWVNAGDPLGHPSCEGGNATGTHVHIARKYNGEWIPADGPLPFNLGGWVAHNGAKVYEGFLTKDDLIITSNLFAEKPSQLKW